MKNIVKKVKLIAIATTAVVLWAVAPKVYEKKMNKLNKDYMRIEEEA